MVRQKVLQTMDKDIAIKQAVEVITLMAELIMELDLDGESSAQLYNIYQEVAFETGYALEDLTKDEAVLEMLGGMLEQ